MIHIRCNERPSIPPVVHGYEFNPIDAYTGPWEAVIEDSDAALFHIGVPGSPFDVVPAPAPKVPPVSVAPPSPPSPTNVETVPEPPKGEMVPPVGETKPPKEETKVQIEKKPPTGPKPKNTPKR